MTSTNTTREGLHARLAEIDTTRATLKQSHGRLALAAAEGDTGAMDELSSVIAALHHSEAEEAAIRAALVSLDGRERREDAEAKIEEVRASVATTEGALSAYQSAEAQVIADAERLLISLDRIEACGRKVHGAAGDADAFSWEDRRPASIRAQDNMVSRERRDPLAFDSSRFVAALVEAISQRKQSLVPRAQNWSHFLEKVRDTAARSERRLRREAAAPDVGEVN